MESNFRFEIQGDWDFGDLDALTSSFKLTYAYFYWLQQPIESIPSHLTTRITRYFWSGDYIGDKFAEDLYWHIPEHQRIRLKAIHYNSPGWIEIAACVPVLVALAFCVRAWIGTADKAVDLFAKIDKYFIDRKLRKIERKISLSEIGGDAIDEARVLCFELGKLLGFEKKNVELMIDLTGNPISTLRLMVTLGKEARRVADLQSKGKLKLPSPPAT